MTYIGVNIKNIRKARNLSQESFAHLFDLNRGSVASYEEGRAEPKLDTIIHIANYFSVSVDLLITREIQPNELLSLNILNEKLDKAHRYKNTKSSTTKGIPLIRIHDYAEYIVNHMNKDFILNLDRVAIPLQLKAANRAFELYGSEMEYNQNGLHHGDLLICNQILDLKLKKGKIYTIITRTGIITRRLKKWGKNALELQSDDPNYEVLTVSRNDIFECWEVRGVFSLYLNPPVMLEEKIMQLEKRVKILEGINLSS